MDRPYGYGVYEEDRHNIAATGLQSGGDQGQLYRDEQQPQHEKKSVLKKVKDKAKKLKDNITHKHGHGGGHDHGRQLGSDEEEGYEDEDEEMEEDAEVHGAPIYDSHQSATTTTQSFIPTQGTGRPLTTQEQERLFSPMPIPVRGTGGDDVSHTHTEMGDPTYTGLAPDPTARSFIPGQVGVSTHDDNQGGGVTFGGSQTHKTPHSTLILTPQPQPEQHHHSPGALPGYGAPQDHIFVKKNTATAPADAADAYYGKTGNLTPGQEPGSLGEALERPHALEEDPRGPGRVHEPENYQSKVTDPTGMGGEEIGDAGAAPVLQALDKMKIYDEPTSERVGTQHTGSHNQFSSEPVSAETSSFLQNPEETRPQFTDATSRTEHDQVHEAGSKKESTYMEKVSSATSVIADKAAQAKNVVASKLGYGGGHDQDQTTARETAVGEGEAGVGGGGQSATSSVSEYGKKVASTVYEKVAGAGTVMMSKVKPTAEEKYNENQGGGKLEAPAYRGVSVTEYIVEKMSPGEEDVALSDVITGAFPLHKEGKGTGGGEGEGGPQKVDPEGKVTLSATVARRLGGGTAEEGSGNITGTTGTGAGVVDKIKEAATGWFGKGGETQPSSVAFHDNTKKEM